MEKNHRSSGHCFATIVRTIVPTLLLAVALLICASCDSTTGSSNNADPPAGNVNENTQGNVTPGDGNTPASTGETPSAGNSNTAPPTNEPGDTTQGNDTQDGGNSGGNAWGDGSDRGGAVPIGQTAVGNIEGFAGYNWLVLDIRDGNALLITRDIIDVRAYNTEFVETTWADCSLRAWLNDEFYDRFNDSEKALILETTIENPDNPWYRVNGGGPTTDMVFLLSVSEVVAYFGNSGALNHWNGHDWVISDQFNSNRQAVLRMTEEQLHDAAERMVANPVYYNNPYEVALESLVLSNNTIWWWWFRSPGFIPTCATNVDYDGYISITGGSVDYTTGGVRPALWVVLDP